MVAMFDSRGLESGVERASERHLSRVASQRRSHLARHVRVTDARVRVREAEGASGPRGSERPSASERPDGSRLHEAQRELDAVRFQAFVVEPARRWNRWSRQQLQRLTTKPQFPSAGREHAVGARDRARTAHAATRRDFEVARVHALLVLIHRRYPDSS